MICIALGFVDTATGCKGSIAALRDWQQLAVNVPPGVLLTMRNSLPRSVIPLLR